jgi:cell wall-associated NlpC family hydrolase
MSPNQLRTSASDPHTDSTAGSHIRRRRHAAPGRPNWVRRAGLVGGVVSAIALGGSAAPALADNTDPAPAHTPAHGIPTVTPAEPAAASAATAQAATLTTAVTAQQAAEAIDQAAIDLSLKAAKDEAAAAAAKDAAAKKKAADEKAAAEAKAAKAAEQARERAAAAQAASRSAERATLATPSSSASATPSSTPSSGSTVTSTGSAGKLISFLKSQLGKPYVYGATGPDSYDCSGLTQVAFATVGVDLPRTSEEQSNVGTPVSVSDVQPGDLIFWGGRGSAYHVGVYIGDGQYLDAANPSTPVAIHPMADYMPDWAVRVL